MPRPLNDSEYLYGLHDPGGEQLMLNAGVPGWVLFTEAVGANPNDNTGRDYRSFADRGLGVMVRLNNAYNPGGTLPFERFYDDFARRCANFVRSSQGANIWIVGNETNHPIEWPGAEWNWNVFPPQPVSPEKRGEPITPQRYVACYRKVRAAIRGVPGRTRDQVLIGAVAPWNTLTKYDGNTVGDWVKYLSDILMLLGPEQCDGITLHAYSHGPDPALVASDVKMTQPEFAQRHWHFRVYRDFIGAIPPNMRHLPVYITEANQGDDAWRNENSGWVRNAYGEINAWNQNHTPKIRSLILYRWPRVGDDRWYIEGKAGVIDDFVLAMRQGYKWTVETPVVGDLAQWWEELFRLESRAQALENDIRTAQALSQRMQTHEAALRQLIPQVDAAVTTFNQLDVLTRQVTALEQEVEAALGFVTPVVPQPDIVDVTNSLPHHPTATWATRTTTTIRRLVIHHTVTNPNVTPQRLAEVAVAQGKPGVAYHYLVSGDGTIHQTQPLDQIVLQTTSTANQNANADSVAIALAGNFGADADVEPNVVQRGKAAQLLAWLMQQFGLGVQPNAVIFGRKELGENVGSPGSQWMEGVRYKDKLLTDVTAILNAGSGGTIVEIERLRTQVATLTARVAELEPLAAMVPDLRQQVTQLQNDVTARQAEITRLQTYINTHCTSSGGRVARPAIVDVVDKVMKHPTKRYSNRTQRITSFVVHHTTGRTTLTPYDIARYHVESREWPGVGYHYLIGADGTIYWCQRHETMSYHTGVANGYTLGVSLIGEFMSGVLPTAPQLQSTSHLIAWLMQEFNITDIRKVIGHKEAPEAQTACPGDQWTTGAKWKNMLYERIQAQQVQKSSYFYLLFWDHGGTWAQTDWQNAQNYIAHFRPTTGFSVDDAALAKHVLIVGGPAGVSGSDEARLRAAGVDVHRVAGADEQATKAQLDALVTQNRLWPGGPVQTTSQDVGLAPSAASSELLIDEWYIPEAWILKNVGQEVPPRPGTSTRVLMGSALFPQPVTDLP